MQIIRSPPLFHWSTRLFDCDLNLAQTFLKKFFYLREWNSIKSYEVQVDNDICKLLLSILLDLSIQREILIINIKNHYIFYLFKFSSFIFTRILRFIYIFIYWDFSFKSNTFRSKCTIDPWCQSQLIKNQLVTSSNR